MELNKQENEVCKYMENDIRDLYVRRNWKNHSRWVTNWQRIFVCTTARAIPVNLDHTAC